MEHLEKYKFNDLLKENEGELSLVRRVIRNAWNLSENSNHEDKLPVPTPVTLERKHLKSLSRDKYFVTEKTDGTRCLLVLFRHPDGGPRSYLCTRRYQLYALPIMASGSFFQGTGTILDGEIVQSTEFQPAGAESVVFLAFDVVTCKGRSFVHETFEKRYGKLHSIIDNDFAWDRRNLFYSESPYNDWLKAATACANRQKLICARRTFTLQAKGMLTKAFIGTVWKNSVDSEFPSDGLILTPNRDAIRAGRNYCLFKWKPTYSIDLEFINEDEKDSTDLRYIDEDGKRHSIYDLNIENSKNESFQFGCSSSAIEDMKNRRDKSTILECDLEVHAASKYAKRQKNVILIPKRWRYDKVHPNGIRAIRGIVGSAADNVTVEELEICCQGKRV